MDASMNLTVHCGHLHPLCIVQVTKDAAMLEAFGKGASHDMRRAKEELYAAVRMRYWG